MNKFHTTPLPYTTVDSDGDSVTIHCILPDGQLLGVVTPENDGWAKPYGQLYTADGYMASCIHRAVRLVEPRDPHLVAFEALPHHVQELLFLTMDPTRPKKIAGIKALRGFLDLGLGEAKRLWELMDENHNNRRWAA